MDVEIGNEAAVPVGGNTTEERVATVTAVDPSALTPSAMRGLRDIGSQVCSILDLYSFEMRNYQFVYNNLLPHSHKFEVAVM